MTRPSPSQPVPLNQVLQATAEQIEDVADRCSGLQHALAAVMPQDSELWEAQSLDLVTQKLGAIAVFLAALAEDLPSHLQADVERAARAVPLLQLAQALTLRTPSPASPEGELELFGEP